MTFWRVEDPTDSGLWALGQTIDRAEISLADPGYPLVLDYRRVGVVHFLVGAVRDAWRGSAAGVYVRDDRRVGVSDAPFVFPAVSNYQ